MKKIFSNSVIIGSTLTALLVSTIFIISMPYHTVANSDICKGISSTNHKVIFQGDYASPQITLGKLCDTITFTNLSNETREISFGPHEQHVAYDGIAEKYLNLNQSFTINLVKTGTYDFHDHIHDSALGNFIVVK